MSQRKSIYIHNSGNALFVYSETYSHVLRVSVNSQRENNTPCCQEIKLKCCYGICKCVCESIFLSFTTPTWQGNSQSSDLKEGETGRGGGETGEGCEGMTGKTEKEIGRYSRMRKQLQMEKKQGTIFSLKLYTHKLERLFL